MVRLKEKMPPEITDFIGGIPVVNIATGERKWFSYRLFQFIDSPEKAVIRAHAESIGDHRISGQEERYTDLVVKDDLTIRCGFWITFRDPNPDSINQLYWRWRKEVRPY